MIALGLSLPAAILGATAWSSIEWIIGFNHNETLLRDRSARPHPASTAHSEGGA